MDALTLAIFVALLAAILIAAGAGAYFALGKIVGKLNRIRQQTERLGESFDRLKAETDLAALHSASEELKAEHTQAMVQLKAERTESLAPLYSALERLNAETQALAQLKAEQAESLAPLHNAVEQLRVEYAETLVPHLDALLEQVKSAATLSRKEMESNLRQVSKRLRNLEKNTASGTQGSGELASVLKELQRRIEGVDRAVQKAGTRLVPVRNDEGDLKRIDIVGPGTIGLCKPGEVDQPLAETALEHGLYEVSSTGNRLSFTRSPIPYFQYYNSHKKIDLADGWNQEFRRISSDVINSRATYLLHDRLYTLWQAVRNVSTSEAPMMEVGVFRGGGSRFLAEAQRHFGKNGKIYSCDTFAGHARITEMRDGTHQVGQFGEVDFDAVQEMLAPYPEIEIVRGDIEETGNRIAADSFAMIHLDVDVYSPTKFVLEKFAPRLVPEGIIVIDDYGFTSCPGAREAVDEFIGANRAFQMFHLLTGQAILVRGSEAAQAGADDRRRPELMQS